MKQAGYKTYFTGKWHVKANAEKAFDVARHIRGVSPTRHPPATIAHCPINPIPGALAILNLRASGRRQALE